MADGMSTRAVIEYIANLDNVKRQVKNLQNINATLAKKLGTDFAKGARVVSNEITKISTSARQIELPSGKFTNQMAQITTVVKGANGKFATMTRNVAFAGNEVKEMSTKMRAGANVTRTFGQNLSTLAKRAALTIPLWFALRQGIGAIFRTIKEGLASLVAFDEALQKAKRNLQGTTADIARNFGDLRKEATKLSLETGRSVEDITNAFQKFATVGFDYETSLAGAQSATKLSILLFGDATETANAFARSMRVLIDTSEGALPASQQMAEIMALTSELWKTNAFELNELTASLTRFAPAAKVAGFSAGESVKLMAGLSTAGLRGSKAGRLLSTSLTRLLVNSDKLAASLGVKLNPETDRTYDVFLKVLDALQKTRSETGKVSPEFEKLTKSIFGLRSGLAVKGLIALRKNLQEVLGVTGDVSKFNEEFEEVNDTMFQLTARFKNLNKEIGKALVQGAIGGEKFVDTLETIVEMQLKVQKTGKLAGQEIAHMISFLTRFQNVAAVGRIFGFAEDFIKKQKEQDKLVKKQLADSTLGLKRALDKYEQPTEADIKIKVGETEITTSDQNKLIGKLVKDQLERIKLDGATEVQVLKVKDALLRQFDVNDDILSQKQREIDIERAITEEQKKRINFSSESVKLAEIAKTEGVETAKAISEVLSGQQDFNTFLRIGGKNAEILKSTFESFVKNKELENFFKGIQTPGQEFVRGGERIPVPEVGGARDITTRGVVADLNLAGARLGLQEMLNKLQNLGPIVHSEKLEISVSVDGKNLSITDASSADITSLVKQIANRVGASVEEKLVNDLKTNNNSNISKAVDERTDKF